MLLKKKLCRETNGHGYTDGINHSIYNTKEDTTIYYIVTLAPKKIVTPQHATYQRNSFKYTCIRRYLSDWLDHLPCYYLRLTQVYMKIHRVWKSYTSKLYETEKGCIWQYPGGFVILEVPHWYIKVLGFWTEPIWLVCCQQTYIYGYQRTILCCVDDLKISHMEPNVVDNIFDILNKKYWNEAPLTVTRENFMSTWEWQYIFQQRLRWSSEWTTTSISSLKIQYRTWWECKWTPWKNTYSRWEINHNFLTATQSNNTTKWTPNCYSFQKDIDLKYWRQWNSSQPEWR